MKAREPRVICVAQQKGGVCKTTATLSLSAAWALDGDRVLMLDTDPQANLTRNILDYQSIGKDLSTVYKGGDIAEIIVPSPYPNLFVAPSRTSLNRVEHLERTLSTFHALKKSIAAVAGEYDFIMIDTPPSLGIFTISALLAATHVLVPVQPTFFCQEGLGDLNETIKEARESNPGLVSVRYFITLFDKRTVISQELAQSMRKQLGDKVFTTMIHKTVAVEESQYAQKTIFEYAPRSKGAQEFRELSREVKKWLAKS
jgi:chromosome partitioning protein